MESSATYTNLRDRVVKLEEERNSKKPWYKSAGIIISIVALISSSAVGIMSYQFSQREASLSRRQTLHQLISDFMQTRSDLIQFQIQTARAGSMSNKNNFNLEVNSFASLYSNKLLLIINSVEKLIKALGGELDDIESLQFAVMCSLMNYHRKADKYFKLALIKTNNKLVKATIYRSLAFNHLAIFPTKGDEARTFFQKGFEAIGDDKSAASLLATYATARECSFFEEQQGNLTAAIEMMQRVKYCVDNIPTNPKFKENELLQIANRIDYLDYLRSRKQAK